MSLEKEIINLLEHYRDTQCGGRANKASENLGVTPATFSRWVTGASLPKVESLIEPFERLNAKIVVNPTNNSLDGGCAECIRLTKRLEEQELAFSKELLSAKEKIIQLQEELLEAQKNKDLQAQQIKKGQDNFSSTNAN